MVDSLTQLHTVAVDFDPFAGPPIALVAPTTEPQQELWTSCMLGGDDASRAYNESVSLRFSGRLDRLAFDRAWQQLVQRHEALRSAFSADGTQMVVFAELTVPLVYHDCSQLSVADQDAERLRYTTADAHHTFDLLNGPLVKPTLLRLTETDHLFLLTAHHIICDGWSVGILLQDLGRFYSGFVQHRPVQLPDPTQISQYALDQRVYGESPAYRQTEQYWLDQYRDAVPTLDLPTDWPRPSLRTFTSARQDYALRADLGPALRKVGAKAGASFVTTIIAAFEVLVHRLTGQTDLIIGLPTAGQSATNNLRLVGHCVNLLPLRSRPQPDLSFVDYLRIRKNELLDALEHQQLTFGSLLKKLTIPRDPSRVPMVPVLVNVDLGLTDDIRFEGLTYRFISNPRAYETVELFLNISGSVNELTMEWSYNTQLFRPDTIDRMMAEFEAVLDTVVQNPAVRLGDVNLSDRNEQLDKLAVWNDTAFAYPDKQPLTQLLTKTAGQFADKVALIAGNEQRTYRELDETSSRVAQVLHRSGIGRGDVIGVLLDRTPDLLVALLAVLKAGAAYVPLDPDYPQDRIAFMLVDSGAKLLLTSRKYGRGGVGGQTPERLIETLLTESDDLPATAPDLPLNGRDLAYILYTSGSTGRPKGVQIEHRSLVNLLDSMIDWPGITPDDRLLAVTTISFDIAGLELYLPLLVGATLVLADAETARDGRALLHTLADRQISLIQATPVTYRMLLAAGWEQPLPVKVLCCGEPLPKDLAQKLTARCASLWNMYGPTETTIYSSGKQIMPDDELITIGRPIHNTQIYILDEQQQPVADGVAGEIYLAGDGVARGYLNRPELTTEKFVADPFSKTPGARMYRTGDLGLFMPDGEVNCLGRIDQQIKIRGYRIEPGEIEQILLREDGVRETLVMAREDRPGDRRLVAYVLAPDLTDSTFANRVGDWKNNLRDVLPTYMVPADFVRISQWPITPNGKIDRKALPKPGALTDMAQRRQPETTIEKTIAAIWRDALGVQQISVEDDFFDLGGHSMIAVQVMTQLETETGRRLPLSTLMTHSTIQKLASLFETEKPATSWKSLVPIRPEGSKVPIYIIHGIGLNLLNFTSLVSYMDPDQPIYGLQARGLDGTDEPFDRMEDIAAFYISEILQQNPDGPYAIAGYSFGGYVALEMAQQLQQLGKSVKMLAMFDTNAEPSTKHWSKAAKLQWRVAKQVPKMLWIGKSLLENPLSTIRYQAAFAQSLVQRFKQRFGFYETPQPEAGMEHLNRIMEKHEIAYESYVFKPYDGVIDLFKAQKRVYFVDDNKFLGWRKYAKQGVRVHEVPGDHRMMMLPPNDKVFAEMLQRALDR
ncbi:non-ribosomal peptide synthetase [uncultured Spirosoma sp.]|uniref:non-ribosomal peptide synthetase n=1 Tax=uncultured Spirosoma sp. TaxID=278208 RepID=UPI00258E5A6F|nr:non-ribosomal peptide synthetase [uncultured Spirosoma sp.]